jgi:photosystem II stability/assembly factor-like uncharacterized protein
MKFTYMKKIALFGLSVLVALAGYYSFQINKQPNKHKDYSAFLKEHPVHKLGSLSKEELEAIPKQDRPDLAFAQNYIMTMDPTLGYPTPGKLVGANAQMQSLKSKKSTTPLLVWQERGPLNVGGRTRALMFDPNDPGQNKVWAGAVTGGLWYNDDIRLSSSTWQPVSDLWSNMAISALEFDPTNPQVFYAGTGEGLSNSLSFGHGAGIWKSTDAGATWAIIPGTENMTMINDLRVRNENGVGVLYVAVRNLDHRGFNADFTREGLYRSIDGGATFTQVLPNVPGANYAHAPADIEIGPDNRIWVGTINSNNASGQNDGGAILYSDDGLNFTVARNVNADRVEIAVAPSNKDFVYALLERAGRVFQIVRTTNGGANWTTLSQPVDDDPGIPANDFSRNQAWYDLIAQVDPNDETHVVVGAINMHRSQDTGNTWQQVSHWYGGFGHPYVHADIHQLLFKPGSSNELIIGSDGGVARSQNFNSNNPGFVDRNRGYNTIQYYAGALHPNAGSDYMLAGSQDNGTQQYNQPGLASTNRAVGGDGAFCFIDQDNPSFQIASTQNSNWRRSFNGGNSFRGFYNGDGRFINPADYDDDLNILYSARNVLTISRVREVDAASPIEENFRVRNMFGTASALKVSPYNDSATTLFVGSGAGKLFKVENADEQLGTLNVIDITGTNFPAGYISCVQVGQNEDELLVTFSNYGITSLWYTNDGGTTWEERQGNLPDMPVRWAIFNPRDFKVAVVATELGVWMTQDITVANPTWVPANSGLANVRVDMLQVRQSDFTVMAITHGRGVYTAQFESGIGLNEEDLAENAITLYPNPAADYLNFKWEKSSQQPWEVKIIDLAGRVRLEATMPKSKIGNKRIALNTLSPGNYLVQAHSGALVYHSKVVVR